MKIEFRGNEYEVGSFKAKIDSITIDEGKFGKQLKLTFKVQGENGVFTRSLWLPIHATEKNKTGKFIQQCFGEINDKTLNTDNWLLELFTITVDEKGKITEVKRLAPF